MIENRITASRTRLLLQHPFFGTIVMHLEPVASEKHGGTAATDGRHLFYHPGWIAGLSDAELDGVMIHEAQHVAMLHHTRHKRLVAGAEDKQNARWNVAADHAINLILTEAGVALPAGGCCDKKYTGWSAEKIFLDLPVNQTYPTSIGVILPGETTPAEQERIRDIVVQAAAAAQSRGSFPEALKRMVDAACAAPVDWASALVDWAQDNRGRDDISYKRFSRRGVANDLYLPQPHSPSHGTLAIVLDTSGSIDSNTLSKFWATARDAMDQAEAQRLLCIACDTEAHLVGDWYRWDTPDSPPEIKGGGGTDFCPALELAAKYDLEGLIYLTDLDGEFPKIQPYYPVLWCSVQPEVKAPFGRTIYIGE